MPPEGMKSIEIIDLHIAADLDVPIKSFLEYAVTQTMHFRDLANKVTAVFSVNQLHHDRLLNCPYFRHWSQILVSAHPVQMNRMKCDLNHDLDGLEAISRATRMDDRVNAQFRFGIVQMEGYHAT